MSTRILILEKISNILGESIDLDTVESIPLKINSKTEFEHEGIKYGMDTQSLNKENISIFPRMMGITPQSDLKGYFNFGFDAQGLTQQKEKKDYKALAKPLAIIVKSLFSWIEKNNPIFVNIFPDGKDQKERDKKINLYGSLLYREKSKLSGLGYTWDFYNSPILGKCIYINKIK